MYANNRANKYFEITDSHIDNIIYLIRARGSVSTPLDDDRLKIINYAITPLPI